MDLLEHEGKALFSKYSIPIPDGDVITTKSALRSFSSDGFVFKAQVPSGKRGKAGGIVFSPDKAEGLFSKKIRGNKIDTLLVEKRIQYDKEMYLSLTMSRKDKSIIVIFSEEGGIDVEELAKTHPDRIIKNKLDDSIKTGDKTLNKNINLLIKKLHKLMIDTDATLVEINPLVISEKKLIALDSKITIDDNALFRQAQFKKKRGNLTLIEQKAIQNGIKYVELDGNIGVIGNGAGLVMATLDLLSHHKGAAANFLDVGGGADKKTMFASLDLCLKNKKVKGLFINIFGGITRCDDIAKGLIDYKKKRKLRRPLVVRMIGTNESLAKELLKKENIEMHDSMDQCAKRIIRLVR
jgi:succinyl-CoA synthetase beta subunit